MSEAFDVELKQDPNATPPSVAQALRYGKKPHINHIFREPTKYPPAFFSLVFSVAVVAALPVLLFLVSSPRYYYYCHGTRGLQPIL